MARLPALLTLLALTAAVADGAGTPSETVVLSSAQSAYKHVPLAYRLEAEEQPEAIDDVMRAGTFAPPVADLKKIGYTRAGLWIRAELTNVGPDAAWKLAFDDTTFNRVDLYVTDGTRVLRHASNGSFVPPAERDLTSRYAEFNLDMPAGARRVLYARIVSYNIIDPAFGVYSADALAARDGAGSALLAWYFGAVAALFLFNLLLYFSLRDRSYLYYCAFVAVLSFAFFTLGGLSDVFLSGVVVGWQRYTTSIGNLTLLAATLFAQVFLNLRATSPRLSLLLTVLAWVNAGAALFALSPYTVASSNVIDILTVVTGVVVLTAAVLALRGGFRPARFYLLSWAALYGMTFVWLGMVYGLLPRNAFTENGILVGAVIEMILMSLGLGDRLKLSSLERTEAREAARAGAAVARAAQMLAHDLKKPFSLLDGLLTALATEPDALRVQVLATRRIPVVRQALAYAQAMLEELQRIGRPERLTLADHDLAPLLMRALRQASAAAPVGADIALRYGLQHSRQVRVDGMQVGRLISNILENAVHAVGSRGRIWVTTAEMRDRAGERLLVTIGNDGPTIPPDDQARLFEAFFTKGKPGGTGLGLAVCRKIVEAHGGNLACTSTRATGTAFSFTLPLGEAASGPVSGLPLHLTALTETLSPTGGLLAVVDDCPFVRESWELGVKDAEVAAFEDPEAFLARWQGDLDFRARLTLVVTDFNFGATAAMDGAALARAVRADSGTPIVLSSDASAFDFADARLFSLRVDKRPHSLGELMQLTTGDG